MSPYLSRQPLCNTITTASDRRRSCPPSPQLQRPPRRPHPTTTRPPNRRTSTSRIGAPTHRHLSSVCTPPKMEPCLRPTRCPVEMDREEEEEAAAMVVAMPRVENHEDGGPPLRMHNWRSWRESSGKYIPTYCGQGL